VGAEALVRWRHPRRGLVAPDVFIGLSEETGLIRSIGAMVLEKAARQQVLWQSLGRRLRISVNLSPRQFGDPGLVDTIARIVRDTGCDPQQIELEITESVMLGQDESTNRALHQLADMGFRLAIDDFGTGYSNLAYLQRCPISTLKIDRSFIAGSDGVSPLARLVITMCRMLGIETVAEGVETEAQLDWLRAQDCDEYQGHLCSPALPADQFERQMLTMAGPA
jgi:EAL domain-containing protein (putative c-di-GMP-specific phosphodiesterase class I)